MNVFNFQAQNDKKLGYTPIQIENDKMKVQKRVEFNYNLNIIKPCDPHLFDNKLWYYRDESSTVCLLFKRNLRFVSRPSKRESFCSVKYVILI